MAFLAACWRRRRRDDSPAADILLLSAVRRVASLLLPVACAVSAAHYIGDSVTVTIAGFVVGSERKLISWRHELITALFVSAAHAM